jgi:hypothetical protein
MILEVVASERAFALLRSGDTAGIRQERSWRDDDDRLEIGLGAINGHFSAYRALAFRIGPFGLHNGGPIVTKVSGGDAVSVSKPLVLDVRYTNDTGVALGQALHPWVQEAPAAGVELSFDVWNGRRWVPAGTREGALPVVRAGLANGASVIEKIRVRIVGRATRPTSARSP